MCVVGLLVLVSTLSTHGVMSGFSTTRGWVGFFAALVAPIGAIGDARVHGFRIVGLTRPLCGRAARPVDLWRTTGVLDRICAHHHPPGSNPSFDPLYTVNTSALPLVLPSIRWNDSVQSSFPPSISLCSSAADVYGAPFFNSLDTYESSALATTSHGGDPPEARPSTCSAGQRDIAFADTVQSMRNGTVPRVRILVWTMNELILDDANLRNLFPSVSFA